MNIVASDGPKRAHYIKPPELTPTGAAKMDQAQKCRLRFRRTGSWTWDLTPAAKNGAERTVQSWMRAGRSWNAPVRQLEQGVGLLPEGLPRLRWAAHAQFEEGRTAADGDGVLVGRGQAVHGSVGWGGGGVLSHCEHGQKHFEIFVICQKLQRKAN